MDEEEAARARLRARERLVEEKIREAMQAGLFDNLPHRGQPLVLEENPFVRPEWRLAFKLLRDAGFAPEWIELEREIRAEREALRRLVADHRAWLEHAGDLPRRKVQERHHQVRERLHSRLVELNARIDRYNLLVPHFEWQRPRLRVQEELERFDRACAEALERLLT